MADVASLREMADTEAHSSYPLGSPLASIVGIADSMLERNDLDEDVATRLRAIRDLALERSGPTAETLFRDHLVGSGKPAGPVQAVSYSSAP
jgi:hypothetical protein